MDSEAATADRMCTSLEINGPAIRRVEHDDTSAQSLDVIRKCVENGSAEHVARDSANRVNVPVHTAIRWLLSHIQLIASFGMTVKRVPVSPALVFLDESEELNRPRKTAMGDLRGSPQ